MSKERGLFRMIFKSFIKSVTPRYNRKTLIGVDYMGTKYYEVIADKDSIHQKPNRYFVPAIKDDFEQELPAEWESWLRNRRKLPPTEEEVMQNYQLSITKKENAAEIEATYAAKREIQLINTEAKPLSEHASIHFPTYEEYHAHGKNYKPKWRKK